MLNIQFQASRLKGSEEEDFLIFFYYVYHMNVGLPGAGPSCNLGPSFEQTW